MDKKIFFIILIPLLSGCSVLKTHKKKLPTPPVTAKEIKPQPAPNNARIKHFKEVIYPGYIAKKGLFSVYQQRDTVYFEIPDSILGRDIMVINRLSKISQGFNIYPGEELDEKVIQFEKGKDSTIRIRYKLMINRANPGDEIAKAVTLSSVMPVAYSFPIKGFGKDSNSYLIDATSFINSYSIINSIRSNDILYRSMLAPKEMKNCRLESVHTYPYNVEFSISKNASTKPGFGPFGTDVISFETHSSFVALPKTPMPSRDFDPRVGYFNDDFTEYGDNQQKVKERSFIVRWNLKPKAEDYDKWMRGELVEPEKPIVFYIDPATPKAWRKYLIMGINDWQKAFEKAGFKNAIMGKEWPENDTTMHMDDVRYSFINYFPSETENAYGPQIHDPRSGEILQSHVGWYHNVMKLLHDWYQIQVGAVDPKARKAKFDEDLMGELIRFVSSHEIGHTLGLRHNFGSSSMTPVDSLRSAHYLDLHGHTASIMDYARFNYVAQPEDHLSENELFPHIGEYDRWAIQWGYKNTAQSDEQAEKRTLSRWVTDSLAHNPRLWFGDGETRRNDPRCQTEDLGDDAMKASTYGIMNLKRILPQLPTWNTEPGDFNQNLQESFSALQDQFFRYMNHVLRNIAGVYFTEKDDDSKGSVYAPVPAKKVKEALDFFDKELFTTPSWLKNPTVNARVTEPGTKDFIADLQSRVVNSLLDITRLNKIQTQSLQFGAQNTIALPTYLNLIHASIWKELRQTSCLIKDPYRRNLQKTYVGAIKDILQSSNPDETETDAASLLRQDAVELRHEIMHALSHTKDPMTRYHLKDLDYRLAKALTLKSNN